MVVIGQWPYQHTVTLSYLKTQLKQHCIYFVDEDKIITYERAKILEDKEYILDDEHFTLMSKNVDEYMYKYKAQIIPPSIPDQAQHLMNKNTPKIYQENMESVMGSAAVLIVNNQSSNVMKSLGATWNPSIGTWICSVDDLKSAQKIAVVSSDKPVIERPTADMLLPISGNVSDHTSFLQEMGGVFNAKVKKWFVPYTTDTYIKIKSTLLG